jgi:cystathionine gamma-lyase
MSLGSVESRVEVPSLMSHASVPKQHLEAIGVDDSLIRLSVGIEDYNDLINDLNYALNKAQQSINTII